MYHVVGVYNGTALKVYRNGTLTGQKSTTATIGNQTQEISIGRYHSQYFNGTIDEVRIYNRSLTLEEISDYYFTVA